ncbi:MAG: 5-formyltetrahydrofolate cyclo-ligase [Candidatus Sumerlaeia bacterium]
MNGDSNKTALRHAMLLRRISLPPAEVQALSFQIAHRFQSEFRHRVAPGVVMGYYPVRNEVSPLPILASFLDAGRRVALPRTDREHRVIRAHVIASLEGMTPGAFGIPEPPPDSPAVSAEELSLCLTPGVAFDRQGRRLGYGGGFYDRFLKSLRPDCLKVALAFHWQIVDTFRADEWDAPVDAIVTECDLIWV